VDILGLKDLAFDDSAPGLHTEIEVVHAVEGLLMAAAVTRQPKYITEARAYHADRHGVAIEIDIELET
jgi:hypothetical protein